MTYVPKLAPHSEIDLQILLYFRIALTPPPSAKSFEVKQWERISKNLKKDGWTVRHVEAMHDAETVWTAIATRGDVRHSTHANDLTLAFQELEECCRKDPLLIRQHDTEV